MLLGRKRGIGSLFVGGNCLVLDTVIGGHLGKNIRQQTGFVEQFEPPASASLGEDANQLVADALRRNSQDTRVQLANSR